MERREFLSWVGTGMVAGSLPIAIVACNPQQVNTSISTTATDLPEDPTPSSTHPDNEGFIDLGSIAELDQRGFLYDSQANIMVVRHGAQLSALNPICTHRQCPIEWNAPLATLSCPCHGSKFATDGSVVTGPATEDLKTYDQVKESDNRVWVKTV